VSERDAILSGFAALWQRAVALGDPALLLEMRALLIAPLSVSTPGAAPIAGDTEPQFGLLGSSPAMQQVLALIARYGPANAPVLISGESGTGKEKVAHALHVSSPRAHKPLVTENCAAIPAGLLESVLFGHQRGAFTGAIKDHPGHFVAADGGSLFLDEIGDMPLAMQVKLLRALQEGEVRPVGGTKVRKVDVRVITATNQDLEQMVAAGRFREDLYFRLNVLRLPLPPLRDRGDDVVLLAQRFLQDAARHAGRPLQLSAAAVAAIRAARWPGNVRQLQNEMQRLVALCDGPEIDASELSPDIRPAS
jgi:transcriptional regulator with GAF, ATPase, and Fis domain